MRKKRQKNTFYVFMLCLLINNSFHAQDSLEIKKWFVALPLRFTHLQNNNTMLSGIKLGRSINNRINLSISIYHSFYLKSFKSTANLSGFDEQPRLFINGMGSEIGYSFIKLNKISLGIQLFLGWGFITYEAKEHSFVSKQVNYLAAEPSINFEYKKNNSSSIGFGLGYRPVLSDRLISYKSDILNGKIPIQKQLPNGLTLTLTLKGFF
ncbi:MAG: hypothetical protein JNJ40_17360 [Bacteroidia bacterium]|nr:hypothetical protein [Bacteroidia bacterium]